MDDREENNRAAFKTPTPGDYWHEMFSPYFVVLKRLDNTMIVCETPKSVDSNSWTWDLEKAIEVPMEYMECVKYKTMDKFVADIAKNSHRWAIEAWEELGSPYVKIKVEIGPTDFKTVMEQGI